MRPLLEVCVSDPESLEAAIVGGAERIELCSALELGGLTPSPGLMRLAAEAPVPVHVLVRPRGGDFVYAPPDVDAMLADIDEVRRCGLAGVVLGASRRDGRLDEDLLARLSEAAGSLRRTLHRAIDLVPDFVRATEAAIDLGFERVLSSGGQRTAPDGVEGLRTIHRAARGRLSVMAGSGLTPGNVRALLDAVPVDEVHSSCASLHPGAEAGAIRLGFAEASRRRTDAAVVAAFRTVLAGP
ncbi:copper homeostasis protein [Rubellimicrobium mesophilum DSM 19309]|uniref:PF03932 family protein CutC n=1 Tax=Rubellimicrobium mesophilum DSM 19309 TaxID=442562 RepID=A0A017HIQ8_9RHOB|nr:copper homeostasis protein CutC [Rubellimicrobium mesophilum]EYD74210.1 copper homeostasis protein [Rubellimicrobium mesophilum DSM 19309]